MRAADTLALWSGLQHALTATMNLVGQPAVNGGRPGGGPRAGPGGRPGAWAGAVRADLEAALNLTLLSDPGLWEALVLGDQATGRANLTL